MSSQDAQRSEVHAATEDAGVAPTHPGAQAEEKDRPQKAVLDTDLHPAKDDSDVGGPLRLTSDDITPRES